VISLKNFDPNWREVWRNRRLIWRADTKEQLEKWVSKHQKDYSEKIYIDEHPKDDWVAFLLPLSNQS
jgi:hypothetical protein